MQCPLSENYEYGPPGSLKCSELNKVVSDPWNQILEDCLLDKE